MSNIYDYVDNFAKIKDIECEKLYGSDNNEGNPYISFVIPTYKRAAFLQEAIDSIDNQTEKHINYEIIVVNNDPTDNMEEIVNNNKRDNIYFYRNMENIGMTGNFNRCILLARGKYISFLHDDDLLKPEYLGEITKVLNSRKYGNYDCIIPNNERMFGGGYSDIRHKKAKQLISVMTFYRFFYRKNISALKEKDFLISWIKHFYIGPTCGVLFKRESILESGGFNDEYMPSPDMCFFIRFNYNYNVCIVRKVLAKYRVMDNLSAKVEIQVGFLLRRVDVIQQKHYVKTANIFLQFFKNELIYDRYCDIENCLDEKEKERLMENLQVKQAVNNYSIFRWYLCRIIRTLYIYLKNYDCFW